MRQFLLFSVVCLSLVAAQWAPLEDNLSQWAPLDFEAAERAPLEDNGGTTSTTTTTAPHVIPTPGVSSACLQIWNATESQIPWCENGLMGALAASFNVDMDVVSGLLGSLMGGKSSTFMSNSSRQDYVDRVVAASPAYNLSPQVAAFARADHIVNSALLGGADRRMGQAMEIAARAFVALVEREANQANATTRRLDEGPDLMEVLAKPLLLLTSKTASSFLKQIIGMSTGEDSGGVVSTPKDGWKSPMINLFDAFCSASQFGSDNEDSPDQSICALYNLITSVLACSDAPLNPDCSKLEESDQTIWLPETCTPPSGPLAGTTFNPRNFVPEFNFKDVKAEGLFDEATTAALLAEEGLSMFFLYRSTSAAMLYYSVHFPCGQTTPTQQLIPGWDLTHTFSYFSQGSIAQSLVERRDTPLVLMLQPALPIESNKCQIIYTIRGTANQFEWGVDFDTVMVPFGIEGVMVHRGFFQAANSIWPNMQLVLDESLEKNPDCAQGGEIILTGHSLGGALSSVLALQISKFYSNVKLTVVTFGSPVMFNKRGSELLHERVNSRNARMDMDPVPRSPCPANLYPGGMIHCNGVLNNGVGFDMYHENPGVLQVDMMREMGDDKQFNLTDDFLYLKGSLHILPLPMGLRLQVKVDIPAPVQIGVAHSCAYACYFSKYCQTDPALAWQCVDCAGKIASPIVDMDEVIQMPK